MKGWVLVKEDVRMMVHGWVTVGGISLDKGALVRVTMVGAHKTRCVSP